MYQILLILLFILSNACYAQNYCKYNKTKYKIIGEDITVFGVAHGTDISAPNNILPKSNGTILGIGFGVSLKKRITKNNYLKTELSLIQKGSHFTFPNHYRESIRLNYIEIPLLWSYSFNKRKKTFFFETGAAISMLIFSSKHIKKYAEQSQIPNAQNFKNIDMPWIISIKVPFNSRGINNLLFGLRFSYSPLSIHNEFKTQSIRMFQDDGMHHISFGIQLDYIFKR